MPQLTFSEKIDVLLANIMANPLFLILLSVPLVAYFISKTKFKKGTIITYLLALLTLLIINLKQIPLLLDNLVEYIINIMMFPTMGLILGIIIIEIVIIIMTFVRNYRKNIKIINSLGFVLIQIMFGISMQIISKNNININAVQNLSASLDLMVLLQMIMMTFILQLGLLLLSKTIDTVTNYLDNTSKAQVEVLEKPVKVKEKKIKEKKQILNKEKIKGMCVSATGALTNIFNKSKDKVKSLSNSVNKAISNKILVSKEKAEARKTLKAERKATKENAKEEIVVPTISEIIPEENTVLEVVEETEELTKTVETKENDEFTYGVVKPVTINANKTSALEPTNEIAEIAARVDNMATSNRFITETNRKQMEDELLAYREQLLIYRQEQLRKEKEAEDLNNIFNIAYDDSKKFN